MGEAGITPKVQAFITDHIESVMQLEVLLLLATQPGRDWSAADLAREMRIDPAWVEGQLRAMADAGQLEVVAPKPGQPPPADPAYRYAPRTPEMGATIAELARAYADRRVTVIGLIFSKPVDKIQRFADAFKLRKDRTDG